MTFDPKARALAMSYTGPTPVTAAATLTPEQLVVQAVPAASSYTITLPAVSDAVGRIYSITSMGDALGTISVVGAGDEADAYAPAALTTTNDRLLCFSDGMNWHTLSTVAT